MEKMFKWRVEQLKLDPNKKIWKAGVVVTHRAGGQA
jgi:hypothetical protein